MLSSCIFFTWSSVRMAQNDSDTVLPEKHEEALQLRVQQHWQLIDVNKILIRSFSDPGLLRTVVS